MGAGSFAEIARCQRPAFAQGWHHAISIEQARVMIVQRQPGGQPGCRPCPDKRGRTVCEYTVSATRRDCVSGTPGTLCYQCNICGQVSSFPMASLDREVSTCPTPGCGSTARFRSIIHILSVELFGRSLALPDFPERKDLVGVGMSDWSGYALPLAEKLSYTNTYYHTDPHLDITDISGWEPGSLDFIISTEVFEHIAPPVSRGFENCLTLLRPGGVLVLSTPCAFGPGLVTQEHFPDLYEYEIVEPEPGHYRLINTTRSGETQEFDDLVFHEGAGVALEMRVFAEEPLLRGLTEAGFQSVRSRREPDWEHGIYWPSPHSWPISARR
jgi:SAM-dependent methyltransferase